VKINNKMLVAALRQFAEMGRAQPDVLRKVADDLERTGRPSTALRDTALLLLDIREVPAELWTDPLPSVVQGTEALGAAVDALNVAWGLTDLHKLVAARRVAWASAQLARAIEKKFAEGVA
jgi:hypothetical protein